MCDLVDSSGTSGVLNHSPSLVSLWNYEGLVSIRPGGPYPDSTFVSKSVDKLKIIFR